MAKKKVSIFILVTSLILQLYYTTQYYAQSLNYHKILGNPLFTIKDKPYYFFTDIIKWIFKGYIQKTPSRHYYLINIVFISCLVTFIILTIINRSEGKDLDTHGTASWGTVNDMKKAKLYPDKKAIKKNLESNGMLEKYSLVLSKQELERDGIVLGRNDKGKDLLDFSMTHIALMAPTRSGKGVGVIIPTLLTWKGSTVVTDIKGENWQLTSNYRKNILGHKCFKFDPTNPVDSCSYNPLKEIRKGTIYEMQDAQIIADIVCAAEKEDHWTNSAKKIFTGVMLHILYVEKEPSIGKVLRFLTNPDKDLEDKMVEILNTKHTFDSDLFLSIYNDTTKVRLEEDTYDDRPCTHPKAAREAGDIISKPDKERESIMSSLISMLGIYANPIIEMNTNSSDFTIKELMNDDLPLNLYLATPPKGIGVTAPIFRLIITQIIYGLTDEMDFSSGTQNKGYKHRLLLLLDEFPALGKIPIVETALAYVAGYGIKTLIIAQDLNQINKIYTKENSILPNCHINMFFTPSKGDQETPKLISNALGDKTIKYTTQSWKGLKYLSDWNHSQIVTGRKLLTPEEVGSFSQDESIILVTGQKPFRGQKIKYYEDKDYLDKLKRGG